MDGWMPKMTGAFKFSCASFEIVGLKFLCFVTVQRKLSISKLEYFEFFNELSVPLHLEKIPLLIKLNKLYKTPLGYQQNGQSQS